jgi:RNA polymerase sigma factor (sigma-70 family)
MFGVLKKICYIVGVINKQNVSLKKVKTMTTMNKMISENYSMVLKAANLFAYRNTRSLVYDLYVNAGIEGLIKATETFVEGKRSFASHAYQCIHQSMLNEKDRIARHNLPEKDDYDFAKYDGEVGEMSNPDTDRTIKLCIRKAVKNNERNAQILEMNLIGGYELKELAEIFNLTHESVRLVCKKGVEALRKDPIVKVTLLGKVG